MLIGRMKGGFYGLKVTQVSLILIAFVCIAVLGLAWTKTSLLTSLNPPQSHVLHLTPVQYSRNMGTGKISESPGEEYDKVDVEEE